MASDMKSLAKEIGILEKEWGSTSMFAKLQESKGVCKMLTNDILSRQFADPLVYNELYNTKKSKVAQKLSKNDLVKMHEEAINSLKNPDCKYHVFMSKELRSDIDQQQSEDIRRKTLHSKYLIFSLYILI